MAQQQSVSDLLRQYAEVLDALRETGVVRSKNNPVGDYAEWLATKALALKLAEKSTKGHDAIDSAGNRYEVKARRITDDNGSRRLSAIRGLQDHHFDWLVGIVFSHYFQVERAAKIPWTVVVDYSTHNEHTNSAIFYLRDQVWDIPGVVDITAEVKRAAESV